MRATTVCQLSAAPRDVAGKCWCNHRKDLPQPFSVCVCLQVFSNAQDAFTLCIVVFVVPFRDSRVSGVFWLAFYISVGPPPAPPRFTLLLLFHTDKLFTPHQRRLLRLSSICLLSPAFSPFPPPSLSVFASLSPSCLHVNITCIPSLVQNPRIFLRCVKENKRPSFYVKLYLFSLSFLFFIHIYFSLALIKPGSLDFKLCYWIIFSFFFLFLHLNKPLGPHSSLV